MPPSKQPATLRQKQTPPRERPGGQGVALHQELLRELQGKDFHPQVEAFFCREGCVSVELFRCWVDDASEWNALLQGDDLKDVRRVHVAHIKACWERCRASPAKAAALALLPSTSTLGFGARQPAARPGPCTSSAPASRVAGGHALSHAGSSEEVLPMHSARPTRAKRSVPSVQKPIASMWHDVDAGTDSEADFWIGLIDGRSSCVQVISTMLSESRGKGRDLTVQALGGLLTGSDNARLKKVFQRFDVDGDGVID